MLDIRPVTDADLRAVTRRLHAEFPLDGMTRDNVAHQIFDDEGHEPTHNLAAWDGDVLRGVLLGVTRGGRAWIKALTIGADPEVPDALLAAFIAALRESCVAVIDVSGSAPFYFLPGVDARDTPSVAFYLRHEFRKVGEAFNMGCDLLGGQWDTSEAEKGLESHGYRLARLRAEDGVAFAEFVGRRFSPGWATEALHALSNQPVTCHVAWHGERHSGERHARRIVAFAAAEVTAPGWFGPMGTHPRHRRHGLGRILLHRCLADLRDLGYRRAEIGWVGPLGFYHRHCGAAVERVFWQYRKEL